MSVVRNFWIEANIDGRKTELSGGPRSRDGGFSETVYIRQAGGIKTAMRIVGYVEDDGLSIVVYDEFGDPVHTISTER